MVVLRVKTVAPLGPLPAATPSVSERRCDRLRRLLPAGELADHRAAELPQMPCAFIGRGVQHVATPAAVNHSVNHRQPSYAIALPQLFPHAPPPLRSFRGMLGIYSQSVSMEQGVSAALIR